MPEVVVLLGGNKGRRDWKRSQALFHLQNLGSVRKQSPVFMTEPWGKPDQPWFWNQALLLEIRLAPMELLRKLKNIEHRLGRPYRYKKWTARLIDLDILVYAGKSFRHPKLTIPHPLLPYRGFALKPLSFVYVGSVWPLGPTPAQLLARCTDKSLVKRVV